MSRHITFAVLAALVLYTGAGAVEFGFDLGTRAVGLWPGNIYEMPRVVRGGAGDLLADVPLSRTFSINFRAGTILGTNQGQSNLDASPIVNLTALNGRLAFMATAPIIKDAISAYLGVAATYCWFRYSSADGSLALLRVSESGVTFGVPAGLKLRLSRCLVATLEMEVPDVGFHHDAIEGVEGMKSTLSWKQYGTYEPGFTAGLYFTH